MKRKEFNPLAGTGPKQDILTRFILGLKEIQLNYRDYKRRKNRSSWNSCIAYLKFKN